jgi:hypothetical protein
MVKAYDHINQELTAKGFKPKLQALENEASAALMNVFTANDMEYQSVPPHCHCRNAAERSSELSKNSLWQGYPLWIRNVHYICGIDSYPRRKLV